MCGALTRVLGKSTSLSVPLRTLIFRRDARATFLFIYLFYNGPPSLHSGIVVPFHVYQ